MWCLVRCDVAFLLDITYVGENVTAAGGMVLHLRTYCCVSNDLIGLFYSLPILYSIFLRPWRRWRRTRICCWNCSRTIRAWASTMICSISSRYLSMRVQYMLIYVGLLITNSVANRHFECNQMYSSFVVFMINNIIHRSHPSSICTSKFSFHTSHFLLCSVHREGGSAHLHPPCVLQSGVAHCAQRLPDLHHASGAAGWIHSHRYVFVVWLCIFEGYIVKSLNGKGLCIWYFVCCVGWY